MLIKACKMFTVTLTKISHSFVFVRLQDRDIFNQHLPFRLLKSYHWLFINNSKVVYQVDRPLYTQTERLLMYKVFCLSVWGSTW